MRQLNTYPYLIIGLLIMITGMKNTFAQEQSENVVIMQVKPQTCVSLHEGQECFAQIVVNWQADLVNDYCLYSTQTPDPVFCWENVSQGTVEYELNTKENVRFMLTQVPKTRFMLTYKPYAIIAEARLNVSWVYKKKQKSRLSWRLF
ncbi:hypothetical protein GCM10008107_24880 [Psychrosphaera saromensis]|nr:hypothetical protein GCM10008107_24880 [Psychrosphaera saromensis]GLQ12601.1 hypothetical protein GCM10007917_00560 [Psychrosphaera saromensis]